MDNIANQNGIFKGLQIIYSALIFGIIGFTAVIFVLMDTPIYTIDSSDIFTIVVPILAVCGVFLSNFLYQTFLNKISSDDSLSLKLNQYQTATIVKAACLEGPAMLAVVTALNTNNVIYLILALVLAGIMYLKFPKKEKFKKEVKLSFENKVEFDKL